MNIINIVEISDFNVKAIHSFPFADGEMDNTIEKVRATFRKILKEYDGQLSDEDIEYAFEDKLYSELVIGYELVIKWSITYIDMISNEADTETKSENAKPMETI